MQILLLLFNTEHMELIKNIAEIPTTAMKIRTVIFFTHSGENVCNSVLFEYNIPKPYQMKQIYVCVNVLDNLKVWTFNKIICFL